MIVTGAGFKPGERLRLAFDGYHLTNVTATRGANHGRFRATVVVPGSATPGTHQISAQGLRKGKSASYAETPFVVVALASWPQFHHDAQHTGVNPLEQSISRTNVGQLQPLWSFSTGYFVEGSPSVSDGVVYACSDDSNLYALDAESGAQRWARSGICNNYASPAVIGDVVFIAGGDVWALEADTGNVIWRTTVSDNPHAPSSFINSPTTFADGKVFAGNNNNFLYAFDAASGNVLWKKQAAGTSCTPAGCASGSIYDSPAVADGRVFASAVDGVLAAYDEETGDVLWTRNLFDGPVLSSPAVVNGVLYIGGSGVHAVDAATGNLLWKAPISFVYSTPVVDGGRVYAGSTNHRIYALDAETGSIVWSTMTGGPITTAGPTLANGVLFVGSEDNDLYALNSDTGSVLWSATVGAFNVFHSTPAVANGRVFVGSYDRTVSAFGFSARP